MWGAWGELRDDPVGSQAVLVMHRYQWVVCMVHDIWEWEAKMEQKVLGDLGGIVACMQMLVGGHRSVLLGMQHPWGKRFLQGMVL